MKNYLFVITTDVGDEKNLLDPHRYYYNGFSENDIATALHSYIAIPYNQKLNIIKEAKQTVDQKTDFDLIIKSWVK